MQGAYDYVAGLETLCFARRSSMPPGMLSAAFAEQSQTFGDHRKVRERARLELLHQLVAMQLDRSF